jgi:hypothetical protein
MVQVTALWKTACAAVCITTVFQNSATAALNERMLRVASLLLTAGDFSWKN